MVKRLLKKTGTEKGGLLYSDGEVQYIICKANRDFEKSKGKKPCMFVREKKGNKTRYISGLFKTKIEYVYTGDILDEIGLKSQYKVVFIDGGNMMTIEPIKTMKGL